MDPEKSGLPPYSAVADSSARPSWRGRRGMRRSRGLKFLGLACLAFIGYAQWRQMPVDGVSSRNRAAENNLSIEKLQADLAICSKLRSKPQDPVGLGRDRNARYIDGHKPTLIRNATVWIGEPAEGTSEADARAGKGYSWVTTDVLLEYGLITKVEPDISLASLPEDCLIYDADGRQLTSGIVDMHSHAGGSQLPSNWGNGDTNEMSADIAPYARSIDGIKPYDHQIQVIKSGGVTTSLILPGSGNNIGGEAYVIKHATGKPDGRVEVSAEDMLADPDRNWRYMKMACGENAKRVYGIAGERGPYSRMGESWEFRHAFEQAASLVRTQDDWCDAAWANGVESMTGYLPQELKWEALGAVLRGQVHVNTHCYTVPDLEAYVDHTNEFKFPVRAFHHAHQTYLVPEILKRAWGGRPPASALFADNMYYKDESYIGSEYAGKILWENGLTPVYVSDNPVLNAQHVVFEAAKAYRYGLPYHVAMASVTAAPAELLGLGQRIGKIKPGFDADVVVWDSDPMSVGATPVQVWIDGTAQYEEPVELVKPAEHPIVPNEDLGIIVEEPTRMRDVVFTGLSKVMLGNTVREAGNEALNLVVSAGKVACIGPCAVELQAAASKDHTKIVQLKNGYVTKSFTAFGSSLGLNEIDNEEDTDNGPNTDVFSRGLDGLRLDNKKMHVAHKYGITKAISAPKFTGTLTHQGTSVGFLTGALHGLEKGAVFADDVAVHYTLTLGAKSKSGTPSISSAIGALRHALLEAVTSTEKASDPYSEKAYLKKVVAGEMPLAITVHNADAIAAILKVKAVVENTIATSALSSASAAKVKMVIIGGAESHIVADELAAAGVGVVLAPLQSYANSWDERRALTGAPLTNTTTVDVLVDAGVTVAIGLEEDWVMRDLALLAGKAYKNGGGRLTEKAALDMISTNVYDMLGVSALEARDEASQFLVFEGSPLEIGSRIKAVAGGQEWASVF